MHVLVLGEVPHPFPLSLPNGQSLKPLKKFYQASKLGRIDIDIDIDTVEEYIL